MILKIVICIHLALGGFYAGATQEANLHSGHPDKWWHFLGNVLLWPFCVIHDCVKTRMRYNILADIILKNAVIKDDSKEHMNE